MKRGSWLLLTAALAIFAIGHAQQTLGDLTAAASSLLRQFGGDGAAAIEAVERLAALPPEALSSLLESAGAAGSVVPEVLRLAGVPEPLLEDPAATLAAARFLALDTRGAIAALNAAVAQAPPAVDAVPPAGPVAPTDAATDPPSAATAPSSDALGSTEPVAAEVASPVSTAVTVRDALGVATWVELGLVLISWVTLTWVFFFFFWRVFMAGNPFLAVRLAYSISVVAVLAYLALVFWPKFFAFAIPADFGYVPYVGAAVLAVLVMIGLWTSYRTEVDE